MVSNSLALAVPVQIIGSQASVRDVSLLFLCLTASIILHLAPIHHHSSIIRPGFSSLKWWKRQFLTMPEHVRDELGLFFRQRFTSLKKDQLRLILGEKLASLGLTYSSYLFLRFCPSHSLPLQSAKGPSLMIRSINA